MKKFKLVHFQLKKTQDITKIYDAQNQSPLV